MEIVIVRHGETEYNKTKRVQGQQQIPLNEKGRRQAMQAAKSLKPYKFTHIYCSNLVRARETADIINESFSLPIVTDNRLNEISLGVWEHKYVDDLLKQYPKTGVSLNWENLDSNPHHGETGRHLMNRTIEFLRHIIMKHNDSDVILIVTHGGPMRIMVGFMKGLHPKEYLQQEIENGQILSAKYENARFTFE